MATSILYLGHPYHALTKSTAFMVDLLRELGSVRVETTDLWNGEVSEELIFVFQSEEAARRVAETGKPFIFTPMYDSSWDRGKWFWRDELRGLARILCFSRKQYEQLRDWGLDCFFVRYFPALIEERKWPQNFLRGSFWWRLEALPLATILKLAGNQFDQLHVHLGADPGQNLDESACTRAAIPIELTRWGEDRSAYANAAAESQVFFAPRLKEGIGMSLLEAMAAGRVVVAPDDATMSEYLTDGVTGFLYDPEFPQEVPLKDSVGIGARARESMLTGQQEWKQAQQTLLDWISNRRELSSETRRYDTDGVEVYVKETGSASDLDRTLKSLAKNPLLYRGSPPNGTAGSWRLELWAGDELSVNVSEILKAAPSGTNRIIGHYVERVGSNDYERRVAPRERIAQRGFLGKSGSENFCRMPHPGAELIRDGAVGTTWHCDRVISRIQDRGFAWKCEWSRSAVSELVRAGAERKSLTDLSKKLIHQDYAARRKLGMSPWSGWDAIFEECAVVQKIAFHQGVRAAIQQILKPMPV